MAVIGVTEDFRGRKGAGKISLSPQKFVRTYTRHFIVRTNSVLDGPLTVLLAPGLPHQFDVYTSGNDLDLAAYCIEGTATPRQDAQMVWDAVFEYTSDLPPPNRNDQNNPPQSDPTKRGTRYGMSYTTISRVLEYDLVNGKAVINSAGEKFDPPLDQEIYLTVLTAERIETNLFVNKPSPNFTGYVNSNTFTVNGNVIAKETALAHIRQSSVFEGAVNGALQPIPYYATVYEFIINPAGWTIAPLDQGTRKRVAGVTSGSLYGSDAKLVTITDAYGQPYNKPVNLDGTGQPLTQDKDPVFLDGTHGVHSDFGPFHRFPETNFPAAF